MPGYEGSSSETTSADRDRDNRVTIKGKLCFIYRIDGRRDPASMNKEQEEYLAMMERRGYKVGVRIRRDQRLELFAFAGRTGDVVLGPDERVSQELTRAFPCETDEYWIGLLPPKGAVRIAEFPQGEFLVVCYMFTIVVTNVRCMPQPVILVLTHEDDSFASHHLMHVLILGDQPGVKMTTKAVR